MNCQTSWSRNMVFFQSGMQFLCSNRRLSSKIYNPKMALSRHVSEQVVEAWDMPRIVDTIPRRNGPLAQRFPRLLQSELAGPYWSLRGRR
ncbi:hypothetical protein BDD14_6210 [Edaphobacter modestus]|uniref:Uncharacterized protein n=1 Tax=Edaphobacter modestus TaxID=388466 RepID=A0A4V2G1K5_9BACT|nr:hypothetical protein BDD14_6210 [Edaphobacter modestus]